MLTNQYSVQQLIFDISFYEQDEAYRFQSRISKLYHDRLHQHIKDFFDSCIPDDVTISLSILQLDLGTISYSRVEDEITERLLKALKAEFTTLVNQVAPTGSSSHDNSTTIVPIHTSVLQSIETFLASGVLPWHTGQGISLQVLEAHLNSLIKTDPAAVREWIMQLGQQSSVRKRMAWQFSSQTIQNIVTLIEPVEAPFIYSYQTRINELQQQTPIVKSDATGFKQNMWNFILTFLIKERGSNFSRKEFVKSTLKQMAAHYNASYHELLSFLNKAANSFSVEPVKGLIKIVREVVIEESTSVDGFSSIQSDRQQLETLELSGDYSVARHFFLYGALPTRTAHILQATLTTLLIKFISTQPETVSRILLQLPARMIAHRLSLIQHKDFQSGIFTLITSEKRSIVLTELSLADSQLKPKSIQNENDQLLNKLLVPDLKYEANDVLSLMKIFLSSGILPWWSVPGFSFLLAEESFRKVLIDKPADMRDWLIQLCKQPGVCKRIIWQLNEQTVQSIINVLEPNEAVFIHSYAAHIGQLQQQIALIKSDTKSFQQDLWYFILVFLTTDKGSNFNRKELVKNNLLQLANHYNVSYVELLLFFIRIQPGQETKTEKTNLLQIIAEIFQETTALVKYPMLIINKRNILLEDSLLADSQMGKTTHVQHSEDKENSIVENVEFLAVSVADQSIESLLSFFIATGSYPWWATAYYVTTPSDLLAALFTSDAASAIRLLKLSGTIRHQTERFLYQFPISIILKIIELLPDGHKATQAYEEVLNLYQPVDLQLNASWLSKEKFVVRLVWQQYIVAGYSSFNELVFYMEAVKQFCNHCHALPDEILLPAMSLLKTYNKHQLQIFFSFLQVHYMHQGYVETIQHLSDEQLTAWLTLVIKEGKLLTEKEALIYTTEYFFRHQVLPSFSTKVRSFTSNSLLKAILLRLQKVDNASLLHLIEKYYYYPGIPQKLHSLFTIKRPKESTVLLALNKLHFKRLNSDFSKINDGSILSFPEKRKDIETPLVQYYCLASDTVNTATTIQLAREILDYFLTWEVLPQNRLSSQYDSTLPIDKFLKELFFILFEQDRHTLHELLKQNTHLPSARIRLQSLFTQPADNKDIHATQFLSIYNTIELLHYFHTAVVSVEADCTLHTDQPVLPVLRQYIIQHSGNEPNKEETVQEGFVIIQHFLSYNQLSESLDPFVSDRKIFLKNLSRYLQNENFKQLEEVVHKATNHPEAKLQIYDWDLYSSHNDDKEMNLPVSMRLQQDILSFLRYKLKRSLIEKEEITLEFLQNLLDESQERVKFVMEALAGSFAGTRFLAIHYNLENIIALLRKVNKTQADLHLETVKDLQILFEHSLSQSSFRTTVNQLLQQFYLLISAENREDNNSLLFISRFFVFLDNHTPHLTSSLHKQLQSFRQYISNISLFNDEITLRHLQKEISLRLLNAAMQNGYDEVAKSALADQIEQEVISSNQPFVTTETKATVHETITLPQTINQLQKSNYVESSKDTTKTIIPIDKTINMISFNTKKDKSESFKKSEFLKSGFLSSVEKTGSKIYVQNAGLILLHPFVSTLFEHTGLLQDRKFVNEQSAFKAIHLLQYIIDGKMEHEEHELPLNKILCGYPLEEPVPKKVELSQNEMNICEGMLKMIFQRWDKMRNTTIDGFRQAFLQRVGMITYTNENWILRVEQKGYDILLTTLPWSYGMIRLPWMEKTIYVEWA